MIQHPLLADPLLRQMVASLVEAVQPARVILFGSRARGDSRADSDYDLLIELETPLSRHAAVAVAHDSIRALGASVDILIRAPGEVDRNRDDPGFIDWDVAREGIVLYAEASHQAGLPVGDIGARDRVRERPEPPSVQLWLERASRDLQVIDVLLAAEPVLWDAVCFHIQQAAEKYLKTLLVKRLARPPRTHHLTPLYRATQAAGYDLPDLFEECRLVEPYAVHSRYPELSPIPDGVTGRCVLAAGRRIAEAARAMLSSPPPRCF